MIDELVVNRWSSALFHLVSEEKKIKEYNNESKVLVVLFQKYPKLLAILSSSILSFADKNEIIKLTFVDFSSYLINFLLLLAQENYFHYLLAILKEFNKQCNAYYGIEYGVVYSVVCLNDNQIKKIEKKMSLITKNSVTLTNQIDQSLIAGIKIKIKNQVFDGSIKSQIDQLKNNLLKNNQE